MKTEQKAFASLSSGLLARKGAAKPAMRPQGFGQMGSGLEDLGWNDMGFEPPKPVTPLRDVSHDAFGDLTDEDAPRHATGLSPVDSPVHNQQAEIAGRFGSRDDEDTEGEDEVDETAELYDPESDAPLQPMAVETRAPVIAPVPLELPPVAAEPAPAVARRISRTRAAPGSKGKAAFTLRLDPERHLRLRLACAVKGRSAQLLVTDALDAFLANMPELEGMAAKAHRKG